MAAKLESQVIVYLRPRTDEAIAILDLESNKEFERTVAPRPEPSDIPLNATGPAPSGSRESTPGPYVVHPRVCQLGFNSKVSHSTRGFVFGSGPDSTVKMDLSGDEPDYFRIHYNLNSGALLVTAIKNIQIGPNHLKENESFLLMAPMVLKCGQSRFQFAVEFPDLTQCAVEHERNYREYVQQLGILDAPYLVNPRLARPSIAPWYRSIAVLGEGGFGKVHKAVHINTGDCTAIKVLALRGEHANLEPHQIVEVQALNGLSHPNIIQYLDACKFQGKFCIVMELALSDLNSRKGNNGKYSLSLECIRSIGRQALSALEYLHSGGKVHRDLKPQNILVTKWDPVTDFPTIKLADLGLASLKSSYDSICGTRGWMAPEVVEAMGQADQELNSGISARVTKFGFDSSVDIWALGKILSTFVKGIPSNQQIHGKPMSIYTEPPKSLIWKMMHPIPKERPTASECLKHPWLAPEENYSLVPKKRELPPSPSQSSTRSHKRAR